MNKVHKNITNREAREFVKARAPFITGNKTLFARWETDDTYVVYSYGQHWPLFVWERTTERWYENEDRYGVTTTRHRSHAHPHSTPAPIAVSTAFIRKLALMGYPAIAQARVLYGAFDELFIN